MTLFERSWAIMKMFDRKVFEDQGIRPEDSPLFMAEIQPLLDQLAAQKKVLGIRTWMICPLNQIILICLYLAIISLLLMQECIALLIIPIG